MAQARNVIWSADVRSSSGFCAITPPAYAAAAAMQSAAPRPPEPSPSDVASPITTAPQSAIPQPSTRARG